MAKSKADENNSLYPYRPRASQERVEVLASLALASLSTSARRRSPFPPLSPPIPLSLPCLGHRRQRENLTQVPLSYK